MAASPARRTRLFILLSAALIANALLLARHRAERGTTTSTTARAIDTSAGDTVAARARRGRAIEALPIAGALRLEGLVTTDEKEPLGGVRVTLADGRATTSELDGSFAFDDLPAGDYDLVAESGAWYGDGVARLDETSDPVIIALVRGPALALRVVDERAQPVAGARVRTYTRTGATDTDGRARLRGLEIGGDVVRVVAPHFETYTALLPTGDDPADVLERTVVLRPGVDVAGTVVDESGAPVPQALVELAPSAGADQLRTLRETTDEHGAFVIAGVGAGTYAARASSDELVAAPDVAVALDGVTAAPLVLHAVRGAEIAGRVVDEHDAPAAGAQVLVGSRTVETGADGRFAARGLDAGDYEVAATTKTAGAASKRVTLAARGHAEVSIVVRAFSIAGTVVDEHGEPVADAAVSARSDDAHGAGFATSDERGRFDLGGLPPGAYEVSAARGDRNGPSAAVTPTHVFAPTRALRLVVANLATIRGRVVLDGAPVPYFGVALLDEPAGTSERPRAIRDANGRFALKDITAADWSLIVVGPGFAKRIVHVRAAPGARDLGEIVVERGGRVRGRVVDARGAGVRGATVRVHTGFAGWDDDPLRALANGSFAATTDATGAFALDGLDATPDPRSISAAHPALGASRIVPLDPAGGDVALALAATGSLAVTAPARASVYSVSARGAGDASDRYTADPDRDGAFRLELPPGTYEITAAASATIPRTTIEITAGAHARLALQPSDE